MLNLATIIKKYILILLEPIIVLIIGLFTVLTTRNSTKHTVDLKRLTHAYHPIFLAAEPYLFKAIDKPSAIKFMDAYNEIEKEYSLYIYPSLRYRADHLRLSLKSDNDLSSINEHWMIICKYIDKDYDKLSKVSYMPIRSTAYRLNKDQFSSKASLYWGMFKIFFLPLTTFYLVWLLFILLIWIKNFLTR